MVGKLVEECRDVEINTSGSEKVGARAASENEGLL